MDDITEDVEERVVDTLDLGKCESEVDSVKALVEFEEKVVELMLHHPLFPPTFLLGEGGHDGVKWDVLDEFWLAELLDELYELERVFGRG